MGNMTINDGAFAELCKKVDELRASSTRDDVIVSLLKIIDRQNEIIATYKNSIDVLGKAIASTACEADEEQDFINDKIWE